MNKTSLFIKELKKYRHFLPKQAIQTIKGQAIHNNIKGARKGLKTSIQKTNVMTMAHRNTRILVSMYKVSYISQFRLSLVEAHKIKGGVRND